MRRPKPVAVGDLVARAVRPPTERDPRWYWRCEHQVDGQRRTVLSGRYDRADVAGALHAASLAQPVTRLTTLGELLRGWTAWVATRTGDGGHGSGQVTARTLKAYRGRRRVLVETWGDHPLEPRARLEQLLERAAYSTLRDKSPATVASWLDAIGSAWSWGRRAGLVADAPLRLPPIRPNRTPKPPVSLELLDQVLGELEPGDARDGLELLRETGIRGGALARLTSDDVDLDGRRLRVQHKGAPRWVPLTERGSAVVRRRFLAAGPAQRLFPALTADRATTSLNEAVARVCGRLSAPAFTTHAIRRRVAVDLVRAGTPLHVYAAIMGHSVTVAAKHYLEVGDEDRDAAAAALDARGSAPAPASPTSSSR